MSQRPSRDASQLAAARIAAEAASRNANGAGAPADGRSYEELFPEPDLDSIQCVATGLHLWAARRSNAGPVAAGTLAPPMVPFEDLPLPRSDRAKLDPCTIRWQFTGRFSLNREEAVARGSLIIQVKCFLQFKNAYNPNFTVTFPRNVGRGRFVDVHVHHNSMQALADAPLVFRGARLQRHLIGPTLPETALVIEITGGGQSSDKRETAQSIATVLQPYAQVHDVWLEMDNTDSTPRPTNTFYALVSTTPTASGGVSPARVQAIPGHIKLHGKECILAYPGRLDWCTTCRSSITQFHSFEDCPRRRCFHCEENGHNAARCPNKTPQNEEANLATRQAERTEANDVELDYGQP